MQTLEKMDAVQEALLQLRLVVRFMVGSIHRILGDYEMTRWRLLFLSSSIFTLPLEATADCTKQAQGYLAKVAEIGAENATRSDASGSLLECLSYHAAGAENSPTKAGSTYTLFPLFGKVERDWSGDNCQSGTENDTLKAAGLSQRNRRKSSTDGTGNGGSGPGLSPSGTPGAWSCAYKDYEQSCPPDGSPTDKVGTPPMEKFCLKLNDTSPSFAQAIRQKIEEDWITPSECLVRHRETFKKWIASGQPQEILCGNATPEIKPDWKYEIDPRIYLEDHYKVIPPPNFNPFPGGVLRGGLPPVRSIP